MSFTETMLQRYERDFERATRHPFLAQAGKGTLDKEVLTKWCRQDYLYAFVGYTKFASLLLAKTPLPSSPPGPGAPPKTRALYSAIALLSFSLSNIKRETDFFVDTAAQHGLHLRSGPDGTMPIIDETNGLGEYEPTTRAYVDLLWGTGAGASVEEGLVLLWAMEKAYLQAWTYAQSFVAAANRASQPETETETQRALAKFIDNWTCDEFVGFVEHCRDVVDGLELEKDPDMATRCEQIFKRVLYLEQRFWPDVE